MSGERQPLGNATGAVLCGFAAIGLIVLVGLGWANAALINGAVIAPGRVEATQPQQVVQHPTGGLVAHVAVRDGATVARGAVLLQLETAEIEAELAQIKVRFFDVLAQRGPLQAVKSGGLELRFDPRLDAEAATNAAVAAMMAGQQQLWQGQRAADALTKEQSNRQQAQISAQIAGLRASQRSLAQRLELIALDIVDQRVLADRGLVRAGQLRVSYREETRLKGAAEEVKATIIRALERLGENKADERRRRAVDRETALAQLEVLRREEAALVYQRDVLERQLEGMTIRAPIAGIVHDLQVPRAQSVIRSGQPLMYLIPRDTSWQVVARVLPSDRPLVEPGQPVRLRLSALNQATTPHLGGRVTSVSADALEDRRTGGSFFRVEIAVDPEAVAEITRGVQLQPGLPVDVFIVTEPRTPMALLIKPVADYFVRAFRES